MDTDTALLIAILVVVVLMGIGMIDMYRRIVAIYRFYGPEEPPPAELRFGESFLKKKLTPSKASKSA
jgi:hypothetical protein